MPRGDRTGPLGYGPRTGRGLGFCAGYDSPGFVKGGFGRGFRCWGRGFGRGWGRGFGFGAGWGFRARFGAAIPQPATTFSPANEKQYLEQEAKLIEQELEAIKKRLQELEAEK
ncbi:MAG: DUF5320 domain-containing protein [Desulfonauticus sp.]|nr:DUF5320 domain-containing protein [Desulfonauticus sp.]